MDDVERILPATERRRAWAREQGYSARSSAFTASIALMAAAGLWLLSARTVIDQLASRLSDRLRGGVSLSLDAGQAIELIQSDVLAFGLFAVWGMSAVWGVVAAINLLQTGFQWAPTAVAADVSRIDPTIGWKRLFSADNVVTAIWSVVVLAAVGLAACVTTGSGPLASRITSGRFENLVVQWTEGLGMAALQLAGLVAALCIVDVVRRRWNLECSLRMTLEERREEAGRTPVTRRSHPRR